MRCSHCNNTSETLLGFASLLEAERPHVPTAQMCGKGIFDTWLLTCCRMASSNLADGTSWCFIHTDGGCLAAG